MPKKKPRKAKPVKALLTKAQVAEFEKAAMKALDAHAGKPVLGQAECSCSCSCDCTLIAGVGGRAGDKTGARFRKTFGG